MPASYVAQGAAQAIEDVALARDQKIKAISQGDDNPDLLGDGKTYSFLWGQDPAHDFLEKFESLIKQALHLLQSVV
ncbi:uncharacterized protein RCO7_11656 [Rhynchosporium graminicola]|uniref:Uncharacterized protein n=1 Tax=Rhynchosporium graminicola TaxID=2792576 RepID=A0A1E1K8B5_9HELO|nr:uncharacterized protein RCO7_11656 [Rhynchosporium commune]